jgi:tartrate dehydratase beta subunit/fumarate hydratase class I family protein
VTVAHLGDGNLHFTVFPADPDFAHSDSVVEAIEDVDLDDLHPESLWRFRIKDFGPLLVAMDSHGGSLYAEVQKSVQERRAAALAKLGVA